MKKEKYEEMLRLQEEFKETLLNICEKIAEYENSDFDKNECSKYWIEQNIICVDFIENNYCSCVGGEHYQFRFPLDYVWNYSWFAIYKNIQEDKKRYIEQQNWLFEDNLKWYQKIYSKICNLINHYFFKPHRYFYLARGGGKSKMNFNHMCEELKLRAMKEEKEIIQKIQDEFNNNF